MVEQRGLADVRERLRAAASSFDTVRATIRDWASYRRISELQGFGWTGASEEAGPTLTRVWIDSRRQVREEREGGTVRCVAGLDEASHWPLFDPRWLADESTLTLIGEREVAGRRAASSSARRPGLATSC